MRLILAAAMLSFFAGSVGAEVSDSKDFTEVTLFAVGDIADCSVSNTSLIPVSSLGNEEIAEHRTDLNSLLPLEPLEIEELVEDQPGIMLGLGDLAYPHGTLEQYKGCFEKVWGKLVSRTYPVLGNHENMTGGEGYRTFWGHAAGGPNNYYSFDYGSWHLIALNSEIDAQAGSQQAAFVEQDLAAAGNRCILAYFHKPAFASLERLNSEHARELFKLLDSHQATLVLNGHNHYYERTALLDGTGNVAPQGIREFVVGTGGGDEHIGHHVDPAWFTEKLILRNPGVLRLDLGFHHYKWQFLSAPSGEVLDSGEGECRQSL
jgi:calcineurin-like phosphoesterase family protein